MPQNGYLTAKQRDIFVNRELRECGRYSIIRKLRPLGCELKVRDNNRDHREWREFFMFFCPCVFFKTAKKREFFCPYVLMFLCLDHREWR